MKVKAKWSVDTGKKRYKAGDEFDVSDAQGEELLAAGAVEQVQGKRGGSGQRSAGEDAQGGAGAGNDPEGEGAGNPSADAGE
ncbi:hypothetical protein MNJPNG_06355 [Cupriavidus oxalaticus]|uniref:DUF7210 family protein n=1 Tax=Cupriavidus oxalaticus TaxID=96344 RepID=UPI003F73892F